MECTYATLFARVKGRKLDPDTGMSFHDTEAHHTVTDSTVVTRKKEQKRIKGRLTVRACRVALPIGVKTLHEVPRQALSGVWVRPVPISEEGGCTNTLGPLSNPTGVYPQVRYDDNEENIQNRIDIYRKLLPHLKKLFVNSSTYVDGGRSSDEVFKDIDRFIRTEDKFLLAPNCIQLTPVNTLTEVRETNRTSDGCGRVVTTRRRREAAATGLRLVSPKGSAETEHCSPTALSHPLHRFGLVVALEPTTPCPPHALSLTHGHSSLTHSPSRYD